MSLSLSGRSTIACLLALAAAGCTRQSPAPEQATADRRSPDEAAPTAPAPAAGTVDRSHKGDSAPAATLTDMAGKPASLATFRGKPLLLNLWATWCAPCLAEMPTLDRTAAKLAGRLTIVVANQGDDAAKVGPYLAKAKLGAVRPVLDPKMAISLGLSANLPTSILYDAAGHEVWRVTGGRDWASPTSLKLLNEAG